MRRTACLRDAMILFLIMLLFIAAVKVTPADNDIVSWYLTDHGNGFQEELLVITKNTGKNTLDTGEVYGNYLKIYSEYEIVKNIPVLQKDADYIFDLSELKPLKVQAGDINGDGTDEIAVCVYKTTEFHPVLAKRPFFYIRKNEELEPVWLGSRLARPFVDYVLFDADGDGIDEIVSIEVLENKNQVIVVYDWKGFGFEVKSISDELAGDTCFIDQTNGKQMKLLIMNAGDKYQVLCQANKIILDRN